MAYGGVWATIFICHLIFGGHLLNIPNEIEILTHRLFLVLFGRVIFCLCAINLLH